MSQQVVVGNRDNAASSLRSGQSRARLPTLRRSAKMKIRALILILLFVTALTGSAQDNQERIRALIGELAVDGLVQGRPRPEPYKAAKKLQEFGAEALPQLVKGLSDNRRSVPFLRVRDQTVGLACKSIIMDMIYALPDSYPGSFYRNNADGERSERPVFFKQIWGGESARTRSSSVG